MSDKSLFKNKTEKTENKDDYEEANANIDDHLNEEVILDAETIDHVIEDENNNVVDSIANYVNTDVENNIVQPVLEPQEFYDENTNFFTVD